MSCISILSMTVASFAVLALVYVFAFRSLGEGPFEMDPGGVAGAFENHLKRYQNLAQLVATLSTATIAFLVNFLVTISIESSRNVYSRRIESACPWVIPLLGFSVIFALSFILLENMAYEAYSHRSEGQESPYTQRWYATNLALGYSSVFLFLAAYGLLAVWLLRQV